MNDYARLIPVNVLTGALGAGKTTLLAALLRAPRLEQTAVLVNEFGEVGIDHHLVAHASETTLLLENGCVCCAMRGDLEQALGDLLERRQRGEVPPFTRVVIETTGIADPVPVAYTLLAAPVLQHHYRLGNVVTVVDAVNGERQLDTTAEAVKQAAIADRLVVTKLDLAEGARLRAKLAAINAHAPILDARSPALDPVELLVADVYDREAKAREVARWHEASASARDHASAHGDALGTCCLTLPGPLDWTAFGIWLTMLLHRHGDRVLRVKGMLDVAGVPGPVLVNGVQHLVHPPAHLDRWPDGERVSRIVMVLREIDAAEVERSLAAFNAVACGRPAAAASAVG